MVTKAHVLDEIRRTARENGGVPLGRKRFYAETGIKESDWLGRHWARWNDAVREAGLQPNTLQAAIDDNLLLEKLALLTRELGRFPTKPDISLRARRSDGFPNSKTFERLGRKAELAGKLVEFCQMRPFYQDVAQLAGAAAGKAAEPETEPSASIESGYVYLLKAGRHYKIGRSNAVGRRERELAIQLPEKATLVHTVKTDDPIGIEQYWHRRFQDKRGNGEWFLLSADDVAAFRRRKFM
ncbi:MAG: GIY-YIG nuclease family protein [Candidatus Polarisedimenticolia bacterium]